MKLPKSIRTGVFAKLQREFRKNIFNHRGKMSNNSTKGYIKLHRALTDNPFYFSEEFSRAQAWIDLILLTNHKDALFFIRGVQIQVKKGQLAYAIKTLSSRWKWSESKVNRFLNYLKNEDQIEYQKNNVTTIITIKNWEKYQGDEDQNAEQTKTRRRPDEDQTKTNKNVKNVKNNIELESIEARAQVFHSQVALLLGTYGKTMLRSFYDYWTEKTPNGKKMRFEMEKTFEVSKRLATWASREGGFKKETKQAAHTNYLPAN